ncbi:MAG TPA: hypothetical protein VGD58_16455 [Herpetosiphonaceae bacterium]
MANSIQGLTLSSDDPRTLEEMYRAALQQGEADSFAAAMVSRYERAPDNPLYAAWYYRLQTRQLDDETDDGRIAWRRALPLALLTSLVFALLTNSRFTFSSEAPYLVLFWSPIVAVLVYLFLLLENPAYRQRALPALGGVVAAAAYVFVLSLWQAGETYQILMVLHLPVLAWLGVAFGLLGWSSSARERFAVLIKTVEIALTGGVFGAGVIAFVLITVGLFEALGLDIPSWVITALFAGGAGLVPVIAVAVAFHPKRPVLEQRFKQGLGRLVPILMRLLLPLTLLVLVVYLCFIPFNFMAPFRERELLIVYNVMLFAVMGLLVGATPVRASDLPARYHSWLRTAILAVAGLSVVIGLYALSAVVYRTSLGGLTPNRLTVIGWNTINIGLLIALLYRQWRDGRAQWIDSLQRVVSVALVIYGGWALFLVLALPLLFWGA